MKPYYEDDLKRTCECGCGAEVLRRFVSGHNTRGLERTPEWLANQSLALKVAWATKRTRMPLGSTRLDSGHVIYDREAMVYRIG